MAREYAERHGLELADLTLRDLGKSAFRGKNAVEGALGEFIRAVDSGKVEPGSYLLVESLDRLSRDRIMPALNQFADLLGKGVRIVTLQDGQEYNESSLDNLQGLIVPLAIMSRANEESETKSKRGRAAWVAGSVPAMLQPSPTSRRSPMLRPILKISGPSKRTGTQSRNGSGSWTH